MRRRGLSARADGAQAEAEERDDVGIRAREELEVVRLVLLRDPDLDEGVQLCAVRSAIGGGQDEGLDVREAKDRGERAARHPRVAPLALPVRQAESLQALDR